MVRVQRALRLWATFHQAGVSVSRTISRHKLTCFSLIPGQSPHITISVLGITGLTAYAGVFAEMKLKKEHTLVVSGAAG